MDGETLARLREKLTPDEKDYDRWIECRDFDLWTCENCGSDSEEDDVCSNCGADAPTWEMESE